MKSIIVLAATVSSVTLKLNVSDDRFSSMWLNIQNSKSNCSPTVQLPNVTRVVTCTGLDATTSYTVEVYTRAGSIDSSPYTTRVNTGKAYMSRRPYFSDNNCDFG